LHVARSRARVRPCDEADKKNPSLQRPQWTHETSGAHLRLLRCPVVWEDRVVIGLEDGVVIGLEDEVVIGLEDEVVIGLEDRVVIGCGVGVALGRNSLSLSLSLVPLTSVSSSETSMLRGRM